ncbi:MAG: ABC transporter permease [Phycisphaerae bacterium]|jgi:putative ABC transport system permease protein
MYLSLAFETARLGLKNIHLHKLRSFLTTLGIICGVGAVICMLSIGEGASEAEMALIRLLGTQNIILTSVKPEEMSSTTDRRTSLLEYGLTREDLTRIRETIPHVTRIVPLREIAFEASYGRNQCSATVVGTQPAFFRTIRITVTQGRALEDLDEAEAAKVCVIGDTIRARLFTYEDPIGQSIIVNTIGSGSIPYKVVGVMARVDTAGRPARGIGERDLNNDIFIPLATADARYGDYKMKVRSGSREMSKCAFSDLYVQVDSLENVLPVSEMLRQLLAFGHQKNDYQIKVPLERLKIAESEKRRRQITLGCIAGISLLVGGIGIMNIMLATVTERTREIGIRRALGAKRRDITMQFLVESLILSTAGGLIGVVFGSAGAYLITRLVEWPTVIHAWTIFVSAGLALVVGVFFGIYPAATAARLDPIEALRHS